MERSKDRLMKYLLSAILMLFSTAIYAWEPPKTITVIAGNPPGAGNEIAFRKISSIVQQNNPNVSFVFQFMPGADQVNAMNFFITQKNDGSVIALPSHMSTFVTNEIWQKNVKKFQYNSFTVVTSMGNSPLVLFAAKDSKVNTPKDFADLVAKTKEPITIAIGGGAHRTAYEYIMHNVGGNKEYVRHLNFNGPAQALDSVLKFKVGQDGTEFGIIPISVAQAMIDDGQIKAIGFTGNVKLDKYPAVPSLYDIAPGIDVFAGWSIMLPPNTPSNIQVWYNREFTKAIRSQEYRDWCRQNLIFFDESDLDPSGFMKRMEKLRATFIPFLESLKLVTH